MTRRSAASSPRKSTPTIPFGGPDAQQFLADLSLQIPVLHGELAEFVDEPSDDSVRARFAMRLRRLARAAVLAEEGFVASEFSTLEGIVLSSAILKTLETEDQERIVDALARIESHASQSASTHESGPVVAVAESDAFIGTILFASATDTADRVRSEQWRLENESDAVRLRVVEATIDANTVSEVERQGPDVIVIDADADDALKLTEELVSTAATVGIPIVVVGSWTDVSDSSPFIALGASRTMAKPASGTEIYQCCHELLFAEPTPFQELGDQNLDALGARLSEELQRAICDSATLDARTQSVSYADGAEILTTIWDAAARIRNLITATSGGKVRFDASAQIDRLPSQPWLNRPVRRDFSERTMGQHESRPQATRATLEGFTIIVAEDDLSTNWFLAGVLRDEGATVVEARDGLDALKKAYESVPDLVLADSLMPRQDGFSLCRAFKNDVLLCDVPVILLSWKSDLLQDLRGLGIEADGYLRKDATGRRIVQRVSEVLNARAQLTRRMSSAETMHGRLDGLSPVTLMRYAAAYRKSCRVTVRDATSVFHIDLQDGLPIAACRVGDGSELRGGEAIADLLSIGDARFSLSELDLGRIHGDHLTGPLENHLYPAVARIRSAQILAGGAHLFDIDAIGICPEHRADTTCFPQSLRVVVGALTLGHRPAQLIADGLTTPAVLEKLIVHLVRIKVIGSIFINGEDVLESGAKAELVALTMNRPCAEVESQAELLFSAMVGQSDAELSPIEVDEHLTIDDHDPREVTASLERHFAATLLSDPNVDDQDGLDAVEAVEGFGMSTETEVALSVPHSDETPLQAPLRRDTPVLPAKAFAPADLARIDSAPIEKTERLEQAADPVAIEPRLPRFAMPSSYRVGAGSQDGEKKERTKWLWPALFAAAGMALSVGARWMRKPPTPASTPMMVAASPPKARVPEQASATPAKATTPAPKVLPLTDAEANDLKDNEGLLEVVAGKRDTIRIDGKEVGLGPSRTQVLATREQPYEIRVQLRGEERVQYVTITPHKRTRVRMAPPWSQ